MAAFKALAAASVLALVSATPVLQKRVTPYSNTTITSTACPASPAVAGYYNEWSCQSAAADGNGYISSYVSGAASFADAVVDCSGSCSADSSCVFFNVYQELSSTSADTICVLWNQEKPINTAINSYNGGKPVSNSAGYYQTSDYIVPGYNLEWQGQTAAADGTGYLSSYAVPATTTTDIVNQCAASCNANNDCVFFNAYQEASATPPDSVCVLWHQDKPLSSATNSINGGKPITASTGYGRTTGPTTPEYTQEWSGQTGAADGAGYLSAYVSSFTSYNDAVSDCAASCTAAGTSCAFINVYNQLTSSGSNIVCVLWTQDKSIFTVTNTYNNGQPISNSNGYLKN